MHSQAFKIRLGTAVTLSASLLFAAPLSAQQKAQVHPLGDTGIPSNYAETIKDLSKLRGQDTALPTEFDWRSYGKVTSAKNQASCGNCWAFAAVGVLESKILIHDSSSYDLSEQFPTSCNTSMSGCSGGSMASLQFWQTQGPMMEACTGFPSADGVDRPCSDFSACPKMAANGTGYYTVDVSNRDNIKTSTMNHGPAYFRFVVHSDFYTYWDTAASGTVYKNAEYSPVGGHAVLIIGWSDTKQAWLLKNSWGQNQGPQHDGTFWLAYTGHANDLGFGMANLEGVVVTPPSDCTCDAGCDAVRTTAGTLNTTGPVCYAITDDIKGWTAWNIQGRVIEVNNVVVNQSGPLPPKINGKYYVGFSAGLYPWAGWTHWTW